MKIFIEGNMSSGKSLYAKLLAQSLKFPMMSMDMARRQLWENETLAPKKRESKARERVLYWVATRPSFVLERIGTGLFDERVDELFNVIPPIKVLIKSRASTCLLRYVEREQGARSSRIILPEYMNDPESFIFKTHDTLQAKERAGHYALVIDNDREKDVSTLKREILSIRRAVVEKMVMH